MSRTALSALLASLLALAIVVAGCAGGKKESASTDQPSASSAAPAASASQQPASSQASEEPDPDDLSQKLKIILMENGWVNQPFRENDEIKQWIDKQYNVDFKLMNIPEDTLEQKLLLAFSTDEQPDIIFAYNKETLQKLIEQGVVIDDWTPHLAKIPTRAEALSDERRKLVTVDGKIQFLTVVPEAQSWTIMVRKDWMANLNIAPPATDVEFYDMLKRFTFDDPDQDGKANTWGLTSAGGNIGVGNLFALEAMYGPVAHYGSEGKASFFVGPDGKLTNNILHGYHKNFLDFVRNAVKDKIISPDWYTQDWGAMQNDIFKEAFPNKSGTAWYPPLALMTESEQHNNMPGNTDQKWIELKMPKGSDIGGKEPSKELIRGYVTISAAAAKDPVRLSRVLKILEDTAYPNPGHFALKEGYGVEGMNVKFVDLGDGYQYWDTTDAGDPRLKDPGMYDYGTWLATNDQVIMGSGAEPNQQTIAGMEMNRRVMSWESYENVNAQLNLDPQVSSYVEKLVKEFNIQYILGKTDDYEGFKQNWLKQGGQKLLDQANEQLGL